MIFDGILNSSNRTQDLTTSEVESWRGSSFNYEIVDEEQFISFIENELIPNIDQNYTTTKYWTSKGYSYTGLFTIKYHQLGSRIILDLIGKFIMKIYMVYCHYLK